MQVPRELEQEIERIRLEMRPPSHSVEVKRVLTSYSDIRRRHIVLAEGCPVEWDYRHEILHLAEWPRTPAKALKHQAMIGEALKALWRPLYDTFMEHRAQIMNMVYDSLVDYSLRAYPRALEEIRKYVEELPEDVWRDPPPHELARAVAAGLARNSDFESLLRKRDVVALGVMAADWVRRNGAPPVAFDVKLAYSAEDFEEAAAEVIAEGGDLTVLEDIAEEEGVRFDEEKAALRALVKAYDWYMEASTRTKKTAKAAKPRSTLWCPGDSPETLNGDEGLEQLPLLLPGITTVRAEARTIEGCSEYTGFKPLTVLLDDSGSMTAPPLKAKAARRVAVSLLALANKRRVEFELITFGERAERVARGTDYTRAVKYLAAEYWPNQGDTRLAPALEAMSLGGTVYIISDAEIHDLNRVAEHADKVRRAVLVVINENTEVLEVFESRVGTVPVKAYHVPPSLAEEFIVRELF